MFRACCLNRSICCFSSTYRWRKTSSASRSLSGGDPRKPRHHPDQSSPNAIPFSLNQKPFSHSSKTQPECSRTLFSHLVDAVEFIVDRKSWTVFADDLGVHLRIVLLFALASVEDILSGIGFNIIS